MTDCENCAMYYNGECISDECIQESDELFDEKGGDNGKNR